MRRYHALATDYDGTIATHGVVDQPTIDALKRVRESGRKLLLVTGRELPDLATVFPHFELFDRIVAENGALIYRPGTQQEQPLAEPPPPLFAELLRRRGVTSLSVGRVIVATVEPNETIVLQVIRELGLELQVIFNKGAVMVLPSGVNKATGLSAALLDLGLSARNVVGVGDAENDHAFLDHCEAGAAVANALPALKERADLVTSRTHGAGVAQLIDQLIKEDLRGLKHRLARHEIVLGTLASGDELRLQPYDSKILVGGTVGGGKSSLVLAVLERLFKRGYQVCIIDPEGDHPPLPTSVAFGDAKRKPSVDGVIQALDKPRDHVVVRLQAMSRGERPAFFRKFLAALGNLQNCCGRPHWLVADDAHHVLPAGDEGVDSLLKDLPGVLLATAYPRQVMPSLLTSMDLVLATGDAPDKTVQECAAAAGRQSPGIPQRLSHAEATLAWRCRDDQAFWINSVVTAEKHRREADLAATA